MSVESIKWQMLFAPIPFVNIWRAYRIKKLRKFVVLIFAVFVGVNFLFGLFMNWPTNLVPFLVIYISLTVIFMRKWTVEWNAKIS